MTPKERREARRQAIGNFVLDFGIYLFALAGVWFSDMILAYSSGTSYAMGDWQWWQLIAAILIAFIVCAALDSKGDAVGKRKNFYRRAINALSQGFMWRSVMGLGK